MFPSQTNCNVGQQPWGARAGSVVAMRQAPTRWARKETSRLDADKGGVGAGVRLVAVPPNLEIGSMQNRRASTEREGSRVT